MIFLVYHSRTLCPYRLAGRMLARRAGLHGISLTAQYLSRAQ